MCNAPVTDLVMSRHSLWFVCAVVLAQGIPDESQQHFNRGASLQQQGNLQGALAAYEEALRINPRRADVLSNLGLVYVRLRQPDQAIELFQKALSIRPELTRVRATLAALLLQLQRFEEARAEAALVVKAEPRNLKARHMLGVASLKLNRLSEGIAALEPVVEASPGNKQAAYTLATAYISIDAAEKAEALLSKQLASEESAEVHMIRGAIHRVRKQYLEALEELERAQQMNGKLVLVHELLGRTYSSTGDFERAKEAFRTVLAAEPKNFHANATLGWVHIRHREYEDAAPYVRVAYGLKPNDIDVLYMMGQIEQSEGSYDEAVWKLERAVEANPDYRPAHVLLARVYSMLGRKEDFAREKAIIKRLTAEEQKRKIEGRGEELPSGYR